MDEVDGVSIDQFDELFFEIDILACQSGDVNGVRDLLPEIRELPRHQVLEPGELVRRQRPAEADRVIDGEMSKVVGGEWDLVADGFPDSGDVPNEAFDRLVRELDCGEGMGGHPVARPVETKRSSDQAPFAFEEVDAQVHLEERVAEVEPGLHSARVLGTVARDGGIGIEPDPVAVATSEHLVHRDLERLAGKVPESHLHAADTAALPAVETELFDF